MKQKHTGGGVDKSVPERQGFCVFNGDFSDHTGLCQRLFGVGHVAGREVETAEASLGCRHRKLSQKTARTSGHIDNPRPMLAAQRLFQRPQGSTAHGCCSPREQEFNTWLIDAG